MLGMCRSRSPQVPVTKVLDGGWRARWWPGEPVDRAGRAVEGSVRLRNAEAGRESSHALLALQRLAGVGECLAQGGLVCCLQTRVFVRGLQAVFQFEEPLFGVGFRTRAGWRWLAAGCRVGV